MKKQYIAPELDVRRYELTEMISGSGKNDDGVIELDPGLLI